MIIDTCGNSPIAGQGAVILLPQHLQMLGYWTHVLQKIQVAATYTSGMGDLSRRAARRANVRMRHKGTGIHVDPMGMG